MAEAQYYIYRGGGRDIVPRNATHVTIDESITVIPAWLFNKHQNIMELICHIGVKRIEEMAFFRCPRLKRLIIPGVEVVEYQAFGECTALVYIECENLKRIREYAFSECESLLSIDLPSAELVEGNAFKSCVHMTEAKFGKNLESIRWLAFVSCYSLERITIPLKSRLIGSDSVFQDCDDFGRIDLVEGEVLRNTVNSLVMERWRNDMNADIDSINRILPNAWAGDEFGCEGDKARLVRRWLRRVLGKIIRYKAEHRSLFKVAASSLRHTLPKDIVMKNILPLLELPSHAFEGEADDQEGSDSSDESLSPSVEGEDDENREEEEVGSDEHLAVGEEVQEEEAEVEDDDEGRKRRKLANGV